MQKQYIDIENNIAIMINTGLSSNSTLSTYFIEMTKFWV